MTCKSAFAALFFIVTLAADASATTIRTPADPALAGASLIDFADQTPGAFTSRVIADVTFTALDGRQLWIRDAGADPYSSTGLNLETELLSSAFEIAFDSPVSAFGMWWGGANLDWTVTLFNNATQLETLTFYGGDPRGPQQDPALATYREFYGATGNGITSVRFDAVPGYSPIIGGLVETDWIKIDDVRWVTAAEPPTSDPAVPEPASLLLMGSGLMAIYSRRRRRQ